MNENSAFDKVYLSYNTVFFAFTHTCFNIYFISLNKHVPVLKQTQENFSMKVKKKKVLLIVLKFSEVYNQKVLRFWKILSLNHSNIFRGLSIVFTLLDYWNIKTILTFLVLNWGKLKNYMLLILHYWTFWE